MNLTVIIPTYNREALLKKCLEALFNQNQLKSDNEIIVIDDGSTDKTEKVIGGLINASPCIFKYFRQKHKGPASARNTGIKNAQGQIILFLGDDIIAAPSLIQEHISWHEQYPLDSIAILGYVAWSPRIKITPFMKWLEESGAQFGYSFIDDITNVSYRFFYTANTSVKRQFLLRYGLFDEEFPYPAFEDIELGYRLSKIGLRIMYNKEAKGFHEHKISQKSFITRSILVGLSAKILHQKHPELKKEAYGIKRFNLRDFIKRIIWHLPPSIAKLIPKKYWYLSYSYVVSYYSCRAYQEQIKC